MRRRDASSPSSRRGLTRVPPRWRRSATARGLYSGAWVGVRAPPAEGNANHNSGGSRERAPISTRKGELSMTINPQLQAAATYGAIHLSIGAIDVAAFEHPAAVGDTLVHRLQRLAKLYAGVKPLLEAVS